MSRFEILSWHCHVCGAERPDDRISVHKRPIRGMEKFGGVQNIRYCNDRPECRDGAARVDLMAPKQDADWIRPSEYERRLPWRDQAASGTDLVLVAVFLVALVATILIGVLNVLNIR